MSKVGQSQCHAQEVGHPRLQRVIRVNERHEAVRERLRVRRERCEFAVVAAARGPAVQAVAVALDRRHEVLAIQGRVFDLSGKSARCSCGTWPVL